jgi:hypothetical protein
VTFEVCQKIQPTNKTPTATIHQPEAFMLVEELPIFMTYSPVVARRNHASSGGKIL